MRPATNGSVLELDAEEQARANVYALLARLFAAPADSALLQGIASSDDAGDQPSDSESSDFSLAWRDLVAAAGAADEAALGDEYHELFVGSGRPEISLYTGAYTARSSVDTPLVALRSFLASHGMQRQTGVHEPEDHIAMLLEIMRYLICEAHSRVDEQKSFFERFLWSGGVSLCDAICEQPRARFYRNVALFCKSLLLVEHDAFNM